MESHPANAGHSTTFQNQWANQPYGKDEFEGRSHRTLYRCVCAKKSFQSSVSCSSVW